MLHDIVSCHAVCCQNIGQHEIFFVFTGLHGLADQFADLEKFDLPLAEQG